MTTKSRTFGEEFRRVREKKGSRATTAKLCNVFRCSPEELMGWELGTAVPDSAQMKQLMDWDPLMRAWKTWVIEKRRELKVQSLFAEQVPAAKLTFHETEPTQVEVQVLRDLHNIEVTLVAPPPVVPEEKPASIVNSSRFLGMPFHEALRMARVTSGLSQSEFSELLGTSQGTLSRWERNCPIPRKSYQGVIEFMPELEHALPPIFAAEAPPSSDRVPVQLHKQKLEELQAVPTKPAVVEQALDYSWLEKKVEEKKMHNNHQRSAAENPEPKNSVVYAVPDNMQWLQLLLKLKQDNARNVFVQFLRGAKAQGLTVEQLALLLE